MKNKVLWQYLKGYRLKVFLGPFFKLLEAGMELLMPIFMTTLINNVYGLPTYVAGKRIVLANEICMLIMCCTIVLGYALAIGCQYFAAVSSMGFGRAVRSAMFDKITRFSAQALDSFGANTLINRLTNDVNQLQQGMAMFLRLITRLPVLALGACIMVSLVNVNMSVIFAIALPLIMLILIAVMCVVIPMYRVVQGKLDSISNITSESILGARVVRAYGMEKYEFDRMDKATDEFYAKSMKVNRLTSLMTPFAALLMNLGIAVIILVGAKEVNNGGLVAGDISAFVTYALWIVMAMTIFANLTPVLTRALSSAGRISDVLNVQVKEEFSKQGGWNKEYTYAVRFENVDFCYIEGKKVLDSINLDIKRGEKVGIIGVTGSGKSTLINMLLGLYLPTSGKLYLGDKQIQEYSLPELREGVSSAPQKAELFIGTVRDNMLIAGAFSDEEIIEALKKAEAYDFIFARKEGLNYVVSKGGKNFSGGQRQRLALARALLKQSEILIFDDSFSALDYLTESKIKHQLSQEKRTVITVSQRVSSIINSDKIVVLSNGKIIGAGTHEQLLDKVNEYREICETQLRREDE